MGIVSRAGVRPVVARGPRVGVRPVVVGGPRVGVATYGWRRGYYPYGVYYGGGYAYHYGYHWYHPYYRPIFFGGAIPMFGIYIGVVAALLILFSCLFFISFRRSHETVEPVETVIIHPTDENLIFQPSPYGDQYGYAQPYPPPPQSYPPPPNNFIIPENQYENPAAPFVPSQTSNIVQTKINENEIVEKEKPKNCSSSNQMKSSKNVVKNQSPSSNKTSNNLEKK